MKQPDADAIGDLLDRIIRHRLVGDAAVPGRAGPLHAVATQRAGFGDVLLNVELRIVVERLAGLGIDALGPVQIVDVLAALDEAAVGAIERVEEPVASEMGDRLAVLTVDRGVVQQVDAVLVVIPGIVRGVLEYQASLPPPISSATAELVEVVARLRLRS